MTDNGLITESVDIGSLTTDPNNARKHPKKNLDAIAQSLEQFGQRRPLVVHGNVVIAGNGTLKAARDLGWSSIVITRVPKEWSEEQARAYALADNRTAELAEWDQPILAEQLLELTEKGWTEASLGFEVAEPPLFEPLETDEQARLDQRAATTCPSCGYEWRIDARGQVISA